MELTIMLLLLGSFVAGFWPAIQQLLIRWSFGDNSYCYFVVPVFLYLCREKRDCFRFFEFNWNFLGIISSFLALVLVGAGEFGSMETLVYIGLWLLLLAVGITLYGRRLGNLWFEFLVLLFIVPLPPFVNRLLTFELKMLASTFSVKMLRLTGISVLQEGNIIDLGVQQLQVVDACSGLRYVLPMFLLALLVGHFYAGDRVRQVVLLILVLPVAILVNSFRIFATGVLSVNGYPRLAENFFHDFAGLVLFLCAALLLVFLAAALNRVGPVFAPPLRRRDIGGSRPKMVSAFFFVVFHCFLLLGSGWAIQKIPATQIISERESFSSFPMTINSWQGRREYLAEEVLGELWADDYVKAVFSRNDRPGQRIYLLIPYYEYQGTRHTAHAPQSCLLGGGWNMLETHDRHVTVGRGEMIRTRTLLLEKGNSLMVASYFFLGRGRVISSPWLNKFYLILDAFTRRRTDGALVRVELSITDKGDRQTAYADLDQFMAELWMVLPRYIPG